MSCRIEINATALASEEAELWGYKGGTIKCPCRERCKGEDACKWEDFRTIEIEQSKPDNIPTQPEKLYNKIEEYFALKNVG
jgi:hypothetical protein